MSTRKMSTSQRLGLVAGLRRNVLTKRTQSSGKLQAPSGYRVTLTPDKVKTTTSPNLDDATKYTEFVFDSPLFLQPGEHCFDFV